MSEVSVSIDQKAGTFTVTGQLEKNPQPSASSGKQLMLATTRGTQETEAQYSYVADGTKHTVPVKINLNLGITNPAFTKTVKGAA